MSIKKNFIYNTILLVSQYIVPLIVFPYISRIFGAEKIGILNFTDSLVNYFILFSTMGLTLTGIREIAKNKNNPTKLNKVFSELFFLHIIVTTIVLIAYLGAVFYFDKLYQHLNLYLIGASKLVFNVFLLEWFFRGMENFKFITIRSIFIKIAYVILLFIFVKNNSDSGIYFALTCGVVVINGLINYWFSRRYLVVEFTNINIKQHLKSFYTIGIYMILSGMTTTFNVIYLGVITTDKAVGYYTTSLKLYSIILGFFSAMNMVLVPRLSSLISEGNKEAFDEVIEKSLNFLCIFSFPIIIFCIVLAPQIIYLAAGPNFEEAIICFRIMTPLIFIVGIAQIFCNQILMSYHRDKDLIFTSFIGAVIGVSLNLILVSIYKEVGTAIVDLISELSITIILYFFCSKLIKLRLPFKMFFFNLLSSIPYFLICHLLILNINNNIIVLLSASVLCFLYFVLSQVFILKNKLIIEQFERMKILIHKK